MSARRSDVRQRVVEAAAGMLARFGPNATSIRELAKRADTPLGSTYHHFPDGKHQVMAEAVTLVGAQVDTLLDTHLARGASSGLRGFLAFWRQHLVNSNLRVGCPVLAVSVEEPLEGTSDELARVAASVFEGWETRLATAFERDGQDPKLARQTATLVIAAVEGAIGLCRAQRSIAPFDRVAAQLEHLARRS